MLSIHIELKRPSHGYDILLEPGLSSNWRREVEERVISDKYIVLVDSAIARVRGLPPDGATDGRWNYLWFGAGESGKKLANYASLVERAFAFSPERETVVVGMGGVTTGGMAGFLAATMVYGLRFVLIPTSLSAQIDSSVGGWNRINTRNVHNGLGLLWQPELVLVDPAALETLPRAEYLAGAAEVVRTAIVDGVDFFNTLARGADHLLAKDRGFMAGVIARCCRIKTGLVSVDETPRGPRRLMRFGHNFGGMLEELAGYDGRVRHGEAVSVGMVLACQLSFERGTFTQEDLRQVTSLLRKLGLPTTLSELGGGKVDWREALSGEKAGRALLQANDHTGNRVNLVMPHGIGDCRYERSFGVDDLVGFLKAHLT